MVYESILGLGLGLKRFLTVSESVFLTKSFIKARSRTPLEEVPDAVH